MANEYLLEMTGISKTFPGAKVLNHIEFRLKPAEVRALIGENGAGKSTFIKILGGIYSKDPDCGEIKMNGQPVTIQNVQDAKENGISIIHQEISLADNMSVYDNLFMGKEIMGRAHFFLNDVEMRKQAQAILDELGVDIDVRVKVRDLSIAKQQMVEISRALLSNAKIIVMDEPTSSLTSVEIEQLFVQIEKLKKAGISVIYISHRMDEIFTVADSVTVLRDGELVGTEPIENLTQDRLITMMVGRELSEIFKHGAKIRSEEECLSIRNYSNTKIKDISFRLKKGEILGFAGLVGAGRTEVARAIFGIDKIQTGELYKNGEKREISNTSDAIALGISYIPENRKTEGLFLMHSIRRNMSITVLDKFIKWVGVDQKYENGLVDKYKQALSIKMQTGEQKTRFLSGGNQQKVVVSKWLATEPEILILDEPTKGIDIGAKADIYQLIFEMANQGKSIILISSEMEEIVNLCDRIIVMHEGRISGEIDNSEFSQKIQEDIMKLASGGNIDAKN